MILKAKAQVANWGRARVLKASHEAFKMIEKAKEMLCEVESEGRYMTPSGC